MRYFLVKIDHKSRRRSKPFESHEDAVAEAIWLENDPRFKHVFVVDQAGVLIFEAFPGQGA